MNRELGLSLKLENSNSVRLDNSDSVRVIREFGQAIEDTGNKTDEASEKLNRLRTALSRVGENLLLQKGAAADLAAALGSLKIDPSISGELQSFSVRSSTANEVGRYLQDRRINSAPAAAAVNALLSALGAGLMPQALAGYGRSLIDALLHKAKEEAPRLPSFNLLWETIDGQIKLVAETWRNMDRQPQVIQAAQEVWQSQIDFMKRIALMAGQGGRIPEITFSLGGAGRSLDAILREQTAQGIAKTAFASGQALSQILGPDFISNFKTLFLDTIGKGLLGYVPFGLDIGELYYQWKFSQLLSLSPDQAPAAFEAFLASQPLFTPVGRSGIMPKSIFWLWYDRVGSVLPKTTNPEDWASYWPHLEEFAKTVLPGAYNTGRLAFASPDTQSAWRDFFAELNQKISGIFDIVTKGLAEAFSASLDSGEYATFEQRFKQSLLGSVSEALIKGFSEQEFFPAVFPAFYGSEGKPILSDVLRSYMSGQMSLEETQGYLIDLGGAINNALAQFEPIWETLNATFQGFSTALGLNTQAMEQNTAAILGPVDNFLMQLDTTFAPQNSLGKIESLKSELYASALADPAAFSRYAHFITSSYLPWRKQVSADYGIELASMRAAVEAIPWVQSARKLSEGSLTETSAQSIGQEVSRALSPMLQDLKESAQITVQVIVDGQVIKQQIIQSLDDPAVVKKLGSRL